MIPLSIKLYCCFFKVKTNGNMFWLNLTFYLRLWTFHSGTLNIHANIFIQSTTEMGQHWFKVMVEQWSKLISEGNMNGLTNTNAQVDK